jgi:two-component system OmpR family response regulator
MLKRPPAATTTLLKCGALEVDPIKHIARKNGITLNMAPRDFALLVFFMRHPDDIFSADSLIARVWESDTAASGEAVRMSISRIRKSIDEKDAKESLIESVSRVGYRLRTRT